MWQIVLQVKVGKNESILLWFQIEFFPKTFLTLSFFYATVKLKNEKYRVWPYFHFKNLVLFKNSLLQVLPEADYF